MTVNRDGDKVWIDGVASFDPGIFASSVHGSQARILETLGEALTYDDLIGYGAFAFRIGLHNGMCPSAGHPCCGYMCIENSTRALPWRTTVFESFPWEEPKEDRAAFEAETCAAVKASIDRGVPVHYGSEEDGLIVGYADQGRRWLCMHPYHKQGRELFWLDEVKGFAGGDWPWGIVVWDEPKTAEERVSPGELLVNALEQAVDMWQTEKRGDYFVGEAAYGEWLTWLEQVNAGRVSDPKAGMQGNGWCYDVLLHSRTVADRWLTKQARWVGGNAAPHLHSAADRYHSVATVLGEGLDCPWSLALPPNRYDDWTSDMRHDEIRRLKAAREHDRKAIEALRRACEALR